MSYSGDCEDVFDSNSKSKWLTIEELVDLAQNSQSFNHPGIFRVEYLPGVKKVKPLDRVPKEMLNQRIVDYLDFSFATPQIRTRIINGLRRAGVLYIGDLISMSRENLLNIGNLSSKSVDTIEQELAQKGLHLSTTLAEPWIRSQIPVEVLDQKVMEYLDSHFTTANTRNAVSRILGGSIFYKNEIIYIGELLQFSREELKRRGMVGDKIVLNIEQALEPRGLYLEMRIPKEWTRPTEDVPIEVLNKKIVNYLDFSFATPQVRTRIINYLKRKEILYIGELIQESAYWLSRSVTEREMGVLKQALAQKGLHLSTTLPEKWEPRQLRAK